MQTQSVIGPRRAKDENIFQSIGFEAFMVVTMKRAVFWDVVPCWSCENWVPQELRGAMSEKMALFTFQNVLFF
jgi:hypothetical protein